ncbi:MAG: hypothetical protein WD470_04795 [Rhodospirillaceae bacterium]
MKIGNKAKLRNTLRKLKTIPADQSDPHDAHVSAQEALDLLSTMAGLKPVMLLGRGFGDSVWIKGVLQVAADAKLHVVEGAFWDASADAGAGADLPDWYLDHTRRAFAAQRAWYIARARAVADEVADICASEAITVAQEARLLGYPECCVRAHYARAADYQRIWLDLLRRKAGGDDRRAAELLASNEPLEPETDEDRSRLRAAMHTVPVPFTSINACDSCIGGGVLAPANLKSVEGRQFAAEIDRGLLQALSG